ncbi:hypothetical protein [Xenorhabdus santafensis]|uniref:hypothetical protein n=1 Tax=Xenorhabdus santafensis TaxID=2582833 RepID=UPI0029E81820|nr:hypothetical protein [Xenorhabdus sp. 12]
MTNYYWLMRAMSILIILSKSHAQAIRLLPGGDRLILNSDGAQRSGKIIAQTVR